jgi:tripeptide aminopeptidase
LPALNRQRLLQRFVRYARIDTTADDSTDNYPSCAGQWELGRMLVDELRGLPGVEAEHTPQALIYATIPASPGVTAPAIAFNAHLDTSPETSGRNVQPQIHDNYDGGDIALSPASGKVIRVAEHPELARLAGGTIITSDGTTLLGADDKAGVAVIMELAEHLSEQPEIRHGPIRLLFTCDEEIGRGTRHVDLEKLGAVAAYTLDGGGANEIDVETFSADLAVIRVSGVNIHPALAKNRMVNAVRAASEFVARLPRHELAPEATAERQGFLHPYQIQGGVAEVTLRVLLRDFDSQQLAAYAEQLRQLARQVEAEFAQSRIDVTTQRQYRNMGEGLDREPRAVQYAVLAHERLGRTPRQTIIRGGTDGSLLTERGLPTPNLSVGQHNLHSPLEWASLEEMLQALEVTMELCRVWAEAT